MIKDGTDYKCRLEVGGARGKIRTKFCKTLCAVTSIYVHYEDT